MPIQTQHWDTEPQGSRVILWDVTGYSGQIAKHLNKRGKVIVEYGWTDTDDTTLATLHAGEGNPSVTTTIDTKGKGSYQNCFLETVRLTGRTRGNGTKAVHVEYVRRWRQLVVGALS